MTEDQTETGGALRADRALEAIEDAFLVSFVDADATIAHGETRMGVIGVDENMNGLAAAVLHGVGQKVGDDLLDAQFYAICR